MKSRDIKDRTHLANILHSVLLWIGVVVAIPLIILTIVYAVSLKHDVAALRDVNSKLLAQVSQQRQLTEQQRQISTQQLEINKNLLDISKQQLSVARSTLETTQSTDSKLNASIGIQQQLLNESRLILQQAQDINRKMPPPTPLNSLGL